MSVSVVTGERPPRCRKRPRSLRVRSRLSVAKPEISPQKAVGIGEIERAAAREADILGADRRAARNRGAEFQGRCARDRARSRPVTAPWKSSVPPEASIRPELVSVVASTTPKPSSSPAAPYGQRRPCAGDLQGSAAELDEAIVRNRRRRGGEAAVRQKVQLAGLADRSKRAAE